MNNLSRLIKISMAILVMVYSMTQALHAAESKTIVVFGASGKIGGLIVKDALERGHKVIGISRNPDNLNYNHNNFSAVKGDITDPDSIKSVAKNADAIAISVTGPGEGNLPENALEARAAVSMIAAYTNDSDAPHIIQIGGATTMFGSTKAMEENIPFPVEEGTAFHGMIYGHMVALEAYRASNIPWTVLTPPLKIIGWGREGIEDAVTSKGKYRTSTSDFVNDAEGNSSIYVRDLAKAAIDEIENGRFVGQRFTIGY
jgi:putative NADH-flavin reductase